MTDSQATSRYVVIITNVVYLPYVPGHRSATGPVQNLLFFHQNRGSKPVANCHLPREPFSCESTVSNGPQLRTIWTAHECTGSDFRLFVTISEHYLSNL